jgi:hypothetical protein
MKRKELDDLLAAALKELEEKVRAQMPAPGTEIDAFMQAAARGDFASVKGFLAAGMPVDVMDDKHCTAMNYANDEMLVRVLLAAGANPNGPEPEPGGFTPLVQAAIHGRADVVRLVLEAGADPNFRSYFPGRNRPNCKTRTALDFARSNRHKEVVELLLQAGTRPGPADFAFEAVKQFAQAADQPAYAEVVHRLAGLCGQSPQRWKKAKGVYNFCFRNFGVLAALHGDDWIPNPRAADLWPESRRAERHLDRLQEEVRAEGYYLVLAESRGELLEAKLRLFPTPEKYAVVAASGLESGRGGQSTHDLIEWLQALDQENPFVVTLCSRDALVGKFLQPIQNARLWAERMQQLCPDFETTDDALAKELEETQTFFLGWG